MNDDPIIITFNELYRLWKITPADTISFQDFVMIYINDSDWRVIA